LRLAGPVLVLALEVGALTPFVEFADGPMGYVANARVCTGLLFALVAFLFLADRQRGELAAFNALPHRRWPLWLTFHLGLYLVFFALTVRLADATASGVVPWLAGGSWAVLGLGVGGTAFLTFLSPQPFARWVWRNRHRGMAALGLGLTFFLLIPWAQGLWPRLCGPALAVDRVLLRWTYGEALVGTSREGFPVLGNRRMLLQVTPQCSELEAVAALWMLAGAVVFSRRGELRIVRAGVALLAGTAVLYLLLAARIYALVVAGIELSPGICVALAHSRVGSLVFLGFAAAVVAGCGRRPAARAEAGRFPRGALPAAPPA
jgi:exosortase/archaeosortase family protein